MVSRERTNKAVVSRERTNRVVASRERTNRVVVSRAATHKVVAHRVATPSRAVSNAGITRTPTPKEEVSEAEIPSKAGRIIREPSRIKTKGRRRETREIATLSGTPPSQGPRHPSHRKAKAEG